MAELVFHFDVPKHFISADAFIASATATQRVTNLVSQHFFASTIQFEVFISAPEPGSLLETLRIRIKPFKDFAILLAAIATFDDTKMGTQIAQELTGHSLRHWTLSAIRELKQAPDRIATWTDDEVDRLKDAVEDFAASATKQTLLEQRFELRNKNFSDQLRFELEGVQSRFYESIISDPSIQALGFSREHDNQINRENFFERAAPPLHLLEPKKPSEWDISIIEIVTGSPNFDRTDKKRLWKGRYGDHHVVFELADEKFWEAIDRDELEFSKFTRMTIQLATKFDLGKPLRRIAIRVLEFNGQKIASPLDHEEVRILLGDFEPPSSDLPLFDDLG